jgi:hypothetical protein
MCTVLLPPGGYPTAVNQIYISYHIISYIISYHKRHDFFGNKKVIEQSYCVLTFSLQNLPQWYLIAKRIERGIVINVYTSLRRVPVIVVRV